MIIAIVIIAFALRFFGLSQSFWLDEAITAQAVKQLSFLELITKYAPGDFHPPLYYLMLKAWSSLFGTSEVALRFPSLLFSVATVYLVFLIGKTIWDKRAGLLAAVFFAVNPLAIYYAQEARMYSLAMFLVALSVYAVVKKKWLLFVISFALAIYSDYLPVFMGLVFLFFVPKRYLAAVGLLFLPWAVVVFAQLRLATSALGQTPAWAKVLGSFDIKALPLTFVKFIIGRITTENKVLYGASMLAVGGLYGFILLRSRSKLVWSWLLLPLIVGLLFSIVLPIYSYFRFLFVLPAFCLLLGRGVGSSKVLATGVVAISLVSTVIFAVTPSFHREDWRSAVVTVNRNPGIILMPSVAQSAPLQYYDSKWPITDKKEDLADYQRAYMFRYVQELFDPADSLRTELEKRGYQRVSEQNFNSLVMWTYEYQTPTTR